MMSAIDDELTGVNGRRNFQSLLRRQVQLANDSKSTLALVVVDIIDFRHINRAHGYEFGDQLLQHVSRLLKAVARSHDYVARLGSDRFAMILPRIMNRGHAELGVQKLLRQFDLPFEADGKRVKIGVTVGVALCPQNATHPDHLLRQAEHSLETARSLRQSFLIASDAGPEEKFSEFWDIELNLAGAHERGEMSMHYQPKLRCADRTPVGAESLMRWNSRHRGSVSPDVFIPVAEQTGQIKALTIWALNTSLRQAAEWKHGFDRLSVAVNVPAELVSQHDLPDLIENALRLWGNDRIQLVMEITERSLISDPRHSFRILSAIRDLGVKVSIDDFGTGYSCLAYFKDIPCDEIKIDRSFVADMVTEQASADLVSLCIDLAHRFQLSVVAEGVEDEDTFEALQQRGCDVAQGWLFARAMASADFEQWLNPGTPRTVVSDRPFDLPSDLPDLGKIAMDEL